MRHFTERFVPRIVVPSFFVLLPFLLFASDWEVPEEAYKRKNPESVTKDSLAKGKEVYEKFCQSCHGPGGGGDGPLAQMLDEKPPAINGPDEMSAQTDGELYWKISKGNPPMPGMEKRASEEERWHLVNYVRSLSSEEK